MSPIVRISDATYERLESHAIGFDTPSNVIERLIDFYESLTGKSQNSDDKLQNTSSKISNTSRITKYSKRPRDIEKERELKIAVGNTLNWGKFELITNSVIKFSNSEKKVLCNYSSYSPEQNRWFWGVSSKYWSNWGDNFYLALLMENEDRESHSFLLLQPNEASYLFTKCSESGGAKKINLRVYKNDDLLHLQEWQEYDVEKNIKTING